MLPGQNPKGSNVLWGPSAICTAIVSWFSKGACKYTNVHVNDVVYVCGFCMILLHDYVNFRYSCFLKLSGPSTSTDLYVEELKTLLCKSPTRSRSQEEIVEETVVVLLVMFWVGLCYTVLWGC